MSEDPRYGGEVLRRLRDTPGAGALPDSVRAFTGRAGDREQGAEVEFDFAVDGEAIAAVRFRAFGCPHFIAGASWLTERLLGMRPAELTHWDWREAVAALEVPPAKFGRLITLQDALRAAAGNWTGKSTTRV